MKTDMLIKILIALVVIGMVAAGMIKVFELMVT